MIKNIVFDIGKVLVRFDWEDYLASFQFPEEETTVIAEAMFLSSNWNLVDEGRLSYEEIEQIFVDSCPAYADDIRLVFAHFGDCITRFPYTRHWISSLKQQGYQVYYLSNYGDFTCQYTRKDLDFCDLMDGGVMSYEVKCLKPDPVIYQNLFEKYHLKPEECVFIDDNAANIDAAKKLWMKTILFQDYFQAQKQLNVLCNK